MSIGKKIGGGFCFVLALTMLLGLWSIFAMKNGSEVSEMVAQDRLPRFTTWSEMQCSLLEAAYFAQKYFYAGSEENIKKTFGYMDQYTDGIGTIKKLNSVRHYENTAKAIDKTTAGIAAYRDLISRDRQLFEKSEKYVETMLSRAKDTLNAFKTVLTAMSGSIVISIDRDDAPAARAYARNIAKVDIVYADMAEVCQDLLIAERNDDLDAFAAVEERVADIGERALLVRKALGQGRAGDLFADVINKYGQFAEAAKNVSATMKKFIENGRERYGMFQALYQDTRRMVDVTTDNSNKYSSGAASQLHSSTMVVGILLCIVLLVGLTVAIIITRGIVRPVTATQTFAENVAAGNLDSRLELHAKDEIGRLADALRAMVDALRQNIRQARDKSDAAEKATLLATEAMNRAEAAAVQAENAKREGMLSAAAQLEDLAEFIGQASTRLSTQISQADHGAAESARRLQEASTAMDEMTATVREVASNAELASNASAETRLKAQDGERVVSEAVRSITQVQKTSLVLKNDMVQLNEKSQDINRIMGVISDIADQTNLLALNAAIEAARAGDTGRGFAIVADEVRKLAEKTMASTKDVSDVIQAIQECTEKSMAAMDTAVADIGGATTLADQSGDALRKIVVKVESTASQVRAIAAASEEQSATSQQINRSIREVNEMSRLTAAAMSDASMAVADLVTRTERLNELITRMKTA